MTKKGNIYSFEIWAKENRLVQGISSRFFGDLATGSERERLENRHNFLNLLGLKAANLVTMEQIHSNKVKVVNSSHCGREIKDIDGMVTSDFCALAVKTADCPSLIAFDGRQRVLAVAHAGWQGILGRIAGNLIKKMEDLGAVPKKIKVGIGPYVKACCYSIDQERAEKFLRSFGDLAGMIKKKECLFYLDLQVPIVFQLIESGVLEKNIEAGKICTACRNDEFFSFRKEGFRSGRFFTVAAIRGKE